MSLLLPRNHQCFTYPPPPIPLMLDAKLSYLTWSLDSVPLLGTGSFILKYYLFIYFNYTPTNKNWGPFLIFFVNQIRNMCKGHFLIVISDIYSQNMNWGQTVWIDCENAITDFFVYLRRGEEFSYIICLLLAFLMYIRVYVHRWWVSGNEWSHGKV